VTAVLLHGAAVFFWRCGGGALKCLLENEKQRQRLPGSMNLDRPLQIQRQR
jgi:hypothetical protein